MMDDEPLYVLRTFDIVADLERHFDEPWRMWRESDPGDLPLEWYSDTRSLSLLPGNETRPDYWILSEHRFEGEAVVVRHRRLIWLDIGT